MKNHNLHDDDTNYVLCGQEPETIDHLLTGCSYSSQVWFELLAKVQAPRRLCPTPADDSLASWWSRRRKQLEKESRKSFDSIMVLIVWNLWLERNTSTFNNKERTVMQVLAHILTEAAVWSQARKSNLLSVVSAPHQPNLASTLGRQLALWNCGTSHLIRMT